MVAPRTALRLATATCAAGSLLLLLLVVYADKTASANLALWSSSFPPLLQQLLTEFLQRHQDQTEAAWLYFADWKTAVTRAALDSARAGSSNSTALFLTVQPLVWLLWWLARLLVKDVVYDILICKGICSERAMRQANYVLMRSLEWQLSLTRQQVALELGLLATVVALVQFYKFLKRRQFWGRVQRRVRAARESVSKVRLLL